MSFLRFCIEEVNKHPNMYQLDIKDYIQNIQDYINNHPRYEDLRESEYQKYRYINKLNSLPRL